MKKRIIILRVVLILLVIPILSAGCDGIDRSLVLDGFVASLTELNSKAMTELSADIDDYDEQIAHLEAKQESLTEIIFNINVLVSMLDADVATEDVENEKYWYYTMTEDERDYYSDEYFELIEFDLEWFVSIGMWELNKDIVIVDRETNAQGTPETLETMLNSSHSNLHDRWAASVEEREDANQILADAIENKDTWQIKSVDTGIYSIGGYGLGYTEALSTGEWYYYEKSGDIEARSSTSVGLRDAITGEY